MSLSASAPAGAWRSPGVSSVAEFIPLDLGDVGLSEDLYYSAGTPKERRVISFRTAQ